MRRLHLDIETFSSVDIKKAGVYKYVESIDFEILTIAYAFNDEPIKIVQLALGEDMPKELLNAFNDEQVLLHAHNATFERLAFKAVGYDIPIARWRCTMIKAAYCGLPLSLEQLSKVLALGDSGKLSKGKALIRYFCMPIKPTKSNGGRLRNFPSDNPAKWDEFTQYNINDVEAERKVYTLLSKYKLPESEILAYQLDQRINDRGVLIDLNFVNNVLKINNEYEELILSELKRITQLENPNSAAQLKDWISKATKKEVSTLAKDELPKLITETTPQAVKDVIELRQKASKTSVRKYDAMLNAVGDDGRARGLFQFYGANRTGRWAGRLIQLQNLPRNYIHDLDLARELVKNRSFEDITLIFDNVADLLSQLIRTSFIAPKGHTLAVADFSAIEARVLSWLAGEEWRLEVFRTHGKIYEASAAMMFNVPLASIGKGSEERQKGKVAELALGYQGAVGAMLTMGGESMGLTELEMKNIVSKWRAASPNIVAFWYDLENTAIKSVLTKSKRTCKRGGISFEYDGDYLILNLPTGRALFYKDAKVKSNKWGKNSLTYMGMDQTTKQWVRLDTYGGKLTENVVQAVSRDLLLHSLFKLEEAGYSVNMHVHDEVVAEVPEHLCEIDLNNISEIMGQGPEWAKGLPLGADGYVTPYYKKD